MNNEFLENKNISRKDISFLQSQGWEELQKHLGRDVFRLRTDSVSSLIIKYSLPLGQSYLYVPHGFIGEWNEKNMNNFLDKIKKLARFHNSFFIRVDPFEKKSDGVTKMLFTSGFKKVNSVQPEETLVLDLALSQDDLLKKMEHDTRYSVRAAERRGVTVICAKTPDEKKRYFDAFWNLFRETNTRHQLQAYPKKYYEEIFSLEGECRSEVFCALVEEKIIAIAIVLFFRERATYLYAASEHGYGRYNAPTFLLWSAINTAKEYKMKIFDFWGISNTKKEWAGVTAFKKSFGGYEVQYEGTWDYILNVPKYVSYNLLKKII